MSDQCTGCGAVCPWTLDGGPDLYAAWYEQHPDSRSGSIDATSETVNAAMARVYGAAGLLIFPLWWPTLSSCACPLGAECKSPAKHPLISNGVTGASCDAETIAAWWRRWPTANIGMAAGANGLAVLDVDPKSGGDLSEQRLRRYLEGRGAPLPDTMTAITGSGGRHYFYRAPEDGVKSVSKAFGPDMSGLDTRGRGGYCVVAPSLHVSGRRYDWLNFFTEPAPWPDLLSRLMDPPKPAPPPYKGPSKPIGDRYVLAALTAEVERVRSAAEGGRNDTLNKAAFALGQFVGAGLLNEMQARVELAGAAAACGLGESEAAKTIMSGLRKGRESPREQTR